MLESMHGAYPVDIPDEYPVIKGTNSPYAAALLLEDGSIMLRSGSHAVIAAHHERIIKLLEGLK